MPTMPVDNGFYVTSGFGPRWGTFHYGTDFGRGGGSGGHPVYAVKDGTVTASGPASGFGQWVNVDHPASNGGGLTVYGHVIPEVRVGQSVTEGQRIARINPDSRTNGGVAPHLHLEWHRYVWSPPGPDRLDPMAMLAGARWPGTPPKKEPRMAQPSTTYTQLTTVDRGWRDPNTVPLIAIHTYECPRESGERALRNRAQYQQTSGTGSYTVLVSADGKSLRANDDNYTPCASLHTGDRLGFHLSFLAYARDSRETWLAYDTQLREAARICAEWCRLYGHQPRHLSIAEMRARKAKGFCTHADISDAFGESDHRDPGKGFPMDVFLRYVTEALNPAPSPAPPTKEDELNTDQHRMLQEIWDQLRGPGGKGWPQLGKTEKGENLTLVDAIAEIRADLDKLMEK
ncbi:M23 family metallopeptidase [Dietzia sp. ANT_WB102]|uniref:M23 family metallopeptidase n=1 Tax=Dietzia sp. ANT_WB102 TaxID=2597345 RepID=UPI0011ECDB1F|nr:M23 family metallopeptidase [Dietzia sp. ANT_WB102]KAA0916472.1 M23 family metallopeptidase [Dietzia sp. ANT_WB102]